MPRYIREITGAERRWWKATGRRLKIARKARGINQKTFAKMLDVGVQTLGRFEKGKGPFNLYTFYRACKILGKCANSMMGRKVKT